MINRGYRSHLFWRVLLSYTYDTSAQIYLIYWSEQLVWLQVKQVSAVTKCLKYKWYCTLIYSRFSKASVMHRNIIFMVAT